jgi:hypothetical protein
MLLGVAVLIWAASSLPYLFWGSQYGVPYSYVNSEIVVRETEWGQLVAAEKNLEVLKGLMERMPSNVCLSFVGDGPARPDLEKLFQGLPVHFTVRPALLLSCLCDARKRVVKDLLEPFRMLVESIVQSKLYPSNVVLQKCLQQIIDTS